MSRKGFRILVIMLAVAVSPLAVTPSMADGEATPVKIAVEPSSQKVLVGGQVEVNLVLQNARNKVAKAPKMMDVIVEFTSPSGQRNQTKVVFKPQETSATITLPVEQSGVFSIHAKQPELLNDDAFIFGVNPKPRSMRPSERRAATIARTQSVTASRAEAPSPAADAPDAAVAAAKPAKDLAISPSVDLRELSASRAPSVAVAPMPPSASESWVELLHRPSRPLLANGIDAGSIHAYLQGSDSGAPSDITIYLFNSQGQLLPIPLVIKAGEVFGTSNLTAKQAGEVTVSYVRSVPRFDVRGPQEAQFSFQPPIVGFTVHASPPEISLLDTSEIGVELLDAQQTPTATDEERRVSLFVDDGHGALENPEIEVQAGRAVARTTFIPTLWGNVTISAATPNLISQTTTIRVTWPVALLILSAVGGLLGALVDNVKRGGPRWSILLGAVIGFVIYWGVTAGLINVLPRAVALNPLSAFAISFLGGAGGTELIKVLIGKIAGHPA